MTQQALTGYSPLGGVTTSANVASRALLSALVMPNPIDGMIVFCSEAGVQAPFVFSLNSGAVVDGVSVLSTSVGGASRWLQLQVGAPTPASLPSGFAGARIASDGTIQINVGIDHVVHVGVGRYDIFLSVPTHNYLVSVAIFDQGPRITHNVETQTDTRIRLALYDSAGLVIDSNFYVVFFKTA